jgi:hypothetical protein
VAVFMNVVPEFASQIGHLSVGQGTACTLRCSFQLGRCRAGFRSDGESGPDLQSLRDVKDGVSGEVHALANTDVTSENMWKYASMRMALSLAQVPRSTATPGIRLIPSA